MNRTAAACRSNAITGDVAIPSEHEYIVAECLEIVGSAVLGDLAVIMQIGAFDIRFLGQVTAEATRVPTTVTTDARHVCIVVRTELKIFLAGASPHDLAVLIKPGTFGCVAAWIVLVIAGAYCVGRLRNDPPQVLVNGTALDQFGFLSEFLYDLELWLAKRGPQGQQVGAACF